MVAGIDHEDGRFPQLSSLRCAEEVASIVGHGEATVATAVGDPHACFVILQQGGNARVVLDRASRSIPYNRTSSAPSKARNDIHATLSECNPCRAIFGEEDVTGNLEDDEAQGVHVGGFIELAEENLGTNVLAIALALDPLLGGPLCCHAKVANLEVSFIRDEDVGGFQIKVDEAVIVNIFQSLSHMLGITPYPEYTAVHLPDKAQA